MIVEPLRRYLEANHAVYHVHEHAARITAQEVAQVTHVSGKHFAKGVLLKARDPGGERFVLAVVPAHEQVDLARLGRELGVKLELASEDEIARVFPDYEVGAAPPIGACAAAQIPVLVDLCLARGAGIAFNAGTHSDVVEMPWAEYARIAQPWVVECGRPPALH